MRRSQLIVALIAGAVCQEKPTHPGARRRLRWRLWLVLAVITVGHPGTSGYIPRAGARGRGGCAGEVGAPQCRQTAGPGCPGHPEHNHTDPALSPHPAPAKALPSCLPLRSRTRFSIRHTRSPGATSDFPTRASRTRSSTGRRISSYFVPVAQPKKKHREATELRQPSGLPTASRKTSSSTASASAWRSGGGAATVGVTNVTRSLLDYWRRPDRERRLFFCQIEALETAIYVDRGRAASTATPGSRTTLRQPTRMLTPGSIASAFKMATGSGKTVVMAMLIAWHALNKLANPQDARFSRRVPDRHAGHHHPRPAARALAQRSPELLPQHDIAADGADASSWARPASSSPTSTLSAPRAGASRKLTKTFSPSATEDRPKQWAAFTETPDQMVRRVCRELGNKRNIVVLNDEAHHCYRRKPDGRRGAADGRRAPRGAAPRRGSAASGSRAGGGQGQARRSGRLRPVGDAVLPARLRLFRGTLFPWVVSDFSLIDAIEVGHRQGAARAGGRRFDDRRATDVPGPVAAHPGTPAEEGSRHRSAVRRPARSAGGAGGRAAEPLRQLREILPPWEQNAEARAQGLTPPVFIVVCNNTNVSKLVFDYVAGWDRRRCRTAQTVARAGEALRCSATSSDGRWLGAAEHDPGRQRAAGIGRGDERRLQEDRRARDRGVQGRVPGALPGPRRRGPDRRGPAARGDEHGRQAGQAGRAA